ncbi:MAG: hypothetical protein SFU98_04740 [Leptospiraceae bacterium]|nr:hypothetical protein [Leptospiraceae bacterium]
MKNVIILGLKLRIEERRMILTKDTVKEKILDYLSLKINLKVLVEWCEEQFLYSELEESDFETLSEILSKIGLADVKNFGIEWHEWNEFLLKLGYKVEIQLKVV